MGYLRAIAQDLRAGAFVMGAGVGIVRGWYGMNHSGCSAEIERPAHGTVRTLVPRRQDQFGPEHFEHLTALDRDTCRHQDLDRVALQPGDGGQRNAGVARRRFHDRLAGLEQSRFSAVSIMSLAMRSLTEPNGF